MPELGVRLFGRDEELAEVAVFVASVPDRPCGLLLQGEAGIGKTALWSQAIDDARDRGIVVLSTRPVESETTFSYSALGIFEDVFEAVAVGMPSPQRRALEVALVRAEAAGLSAGSARGIGGGPQRAPIARGDVSRSSSRSMTSTGSIRRRPGYWDSRFAA